MKLKLMEVYGTVDYLSEGDIKNGITSNYVKDYCYVLHDSDVYNADDEKENAEHKAGTLKKPHWHVFLRLKDSTDSKYIAEAFGVEENFINRVKGKWVDVLLYATHKNAPSKFQYSDEDVVSNFNFAEVRDAEEKKKQNNNRLSEIITQICDGTIREYNYTNYINGTEYTMYKTKIDAAFKYRQDKMKGAKRNMEVVYIVGESGSGKTTYAQEFATSKNMSYYISSGSNDVLDDYKGEDCLILDEMRPDVLGLADLLKMLDNNTSSSVKSRYRNKILECKLIIITTVWDINEFFNAMYGSDREPIKQLKRRCKTYIKMTPKTMAINLYDPKLEDYVYFETYENPVQFLYPTEELTKEKAYDFIENLLGATLKGVKRIRELDCPIDEKKYEEVKIETETKQGNLFDYL